MRMFIGLSLALCFIHTAQAQQNLNEALGVISNFADRICTDIPLTGNGNTIELEGAAKADLKGIIGKIIDLGIEGAAKYRDFEYQNVLQEDLVEALKDSRDCKLIIWKDLRENLLGSSEMLFKTKNSTASLEYWREMNRLYNTHNPIIAAAFDGTSYSNPLDRAIEARNGARRASTALDNFVNEQTIYSVVGVDDELAFFYSKYRSLLVRMSDHLKRIVSLSNQMITYFQNGLSPPPNLILSFDDHNNFVGSIIQEMNNHRSEIDNLRVNLTKKFNIDFSY